MNSSYWFELAVVFGLTAVGTILLTEEEAKWRRAAQVLLTARSR